jgi:hypothetical protein
MMQVLGFKVDAGGNAPEEKEWKSRQQAAG